MSKILKVTANDDYTIIVEFQQGNKILFNMQQLIKTMQYCSLKDINRFKNITIEDKAIYWPAVGDPEFRMIPVRLTVDNMLFTIRD